MDAAPERIRIDVEDDLAAVGCSSALGETLPRKRLRQPCRSSDRQSCPFRPSPHRTRPRARARPSGPTHRPAAAAARTSSAQLVDAHSASPAAVDRAHEHGRNLRVEPTPDLVHPGPVREDRERAPTVPLPFPLDLSASRRGSRQCAHLRKRQLASRHRLVDLRKVLERVRHVYLLARRDQLDARTKSSQCAHERWPSAAQPRRRSNSAMRTRS